MAKLTLQREFGVRGRDIYLATLLKAENLHVFIANLRSSLSRAEHPIQANWGKVQPQKTDCDSSFLQPFR